MKTLKEFLAEAPVSPFWAGNKSITSIKNYQKGGSDSKVVQAIRDLYQSFLPEFKKVQKKFVSIVNKSLPKGDKQTIKFFSQIKPEDSLVNKIAVRGNAPDKIGDIVRGALLFPSNDMVDAFIKDFRRKNSSIIVGYEMKTKGNDPELGYFGSHHLDLMINGLVVELQVMTRKMWKFKEVAHDLYTKNRDTISKGGHASKFDSYLSKKIYSLANKEEFEGITADDLLTLMDEDFFAFREVKIIS